MEAKPTALTLGVLGVIAFVTAVRAIVFSQLELFSTESYLWVCSQRPALSYFDYPGMIAWMGWLSTALFGHGSLGVRAVTLIGGGVMIGLVFLAARRLYDERVAALAAFTAALVPNFLAFAAEATPDAPCLLFWAATLWALAHALSGDSPRWWYAAGLFLGLAMDSKYHAVFLGFGVFGFLLLSPDQRFWLRRKEPWGAVGVAIVAFLPTLVWNAQNGWQSFLYQGLSRFQESGFQPSQLWKFPKNQLLLVTPFLCIGAWACGIAAFLNWRTADWRDRLLAAVGMPMLLFFFLVIFSRPVRGHWPVHGYMGPLILSCAVALRRGVWMRRAYYGSVAALGIGILLVPALLALIPVEQRSGWRKLADEAAARRPDFYVSNDYHVASQLGYQLRTLEVWDLTPAGIPAKNFPNWWRSDAHLGQKALIVFDERHYPGHIDRVKEAFERVGPETRLTISRFQTDRLGLQLGEKDPYVILEAWNYRGPKRVERRVLPSED